MEEMEKTEINNSDLILPIRTKRYIRPTRVEINLNNLEHNLKTIKSCLSSNPRILAVVKADAYGHGALPVAKELSRLGVYGFAVALVEEGVELRTGGIKEPIIILGGIETEDGLFSALKYSLTPVIFKQRHIDLCHNFWLRYGFEYIKAHLKVDTGMHRLGFCWNDFENLLKNIHKYSWLQVEGIMSHFAYADEENSESTLKQYHNFNEFIKIAANYGVKPSLLHIANSSALLKYNFTHFSLVRPGLALYGIAPFKGNNISDLKPLMKVSTHVVQLKDIMPGHRVSYNGIFTAKRPTKIAVLPIGYADGLMRVLSQNGEVLVRGKRAKIAGNICMDLTMIDVTDIPDIKEGDEVIILGQQQDENITAYEIASLANTIPYEIVTSFSARMPRYYNNNS